MKIPFENVPIFKLLSTSFCLLSKMFPNALGLNLTLQINGQSRVRNAQWLLERATCYCKAGSGQIIDLNQIQLHAGNVLTLGLELVQLNISTRVHFDKSTPATIHQSPFFYNDKTDCLKFEKSIEINIWIQFFEEINFLICDDVILIFK